MKLELEEQWAINDFLKNNWEAFKLTALEFMDIEQIEALGDKLGKNQ